MSIVKYNNNSVSDVTSGASLVNGAMTHIKTLTASSSATLSFVHGSSDVVLDSTYPIYLFKFINIHPSNDARALTFNGSDDDSSHSYDVTKTTTFYRAYHNEGDGTTSLTYDGNYDLAQSTDFQKLTVEDIGSDNDQSCSGELYLFNPSSTTFVKHFMSNLNYSHNSDLTVQSVVAGYFNTTADITAIQFKANSNNIDSGTIKLYGIKDS